MDTDSLFAQQADLARGAAGWLAGYILAATAAYAIVDIFFFEKNGLYLASSILVWGLGYVLLVMLMRASAPAGEKELGGIGGYFGLGILTGLAIFLGLVVLLLPGLYLMMRWLPAFARLQHKGEGVIEAMGWSWEHTAPMQKPLALALIAPLLLYLSFIGLVVWQELNLDSLSETAFNFSLVAMNLAVSVAVAWLQLLGVAAYRVIQRERAAPVETFE